jgi:hypothetical protein
MSTRSSSSAGVYLLSGCDGCILHDGHDKLVTILPESTNNLLILSLPSLIKAACKKSHQQIM